MKRLQNEGFDDASKLFHLIKFRIINNPSSIRLNGDHVRPVFTRDDIVELIQVRCMHGLSKGAVRSDDGHDDFPLEFVAFKKRLEGAVVINHVHETHAHGKYRNPIPDEFEIQKASHSLAFFRDGIEQEIHVDLGIDELILTDVNNPERERGFSLEFMQGDFFCELNFRLRPGKLSEEKSCHNRDDHNPDRCFEGDHHMGESRRR